MKNVQFLHPFPPFSVCPNGSELEKTPCLWTLKLRLPNTPHHPDSLWYSCSILIIFSRPFHHLPCPRNSQHFTTKNQFKLNSLFCSKIQVNTSHLECQNALMAEPNTSLEHLGQNQTTVWNTVWTLITLILIIALDIQFLWIPSPSSPL